MKFQTSLLTISIFVFLFSVFSCSSQDTPTANQLLGRWAMIQVFDQGTDVTEEHNPEKERWIEFLADGSFISDGQPFGRNTGTWDFDLTSKELYLDSDAGEDDDSYWIVGLDDNRMSWQGTRFDFAKRFRIEHKLMETR